ncbi:MAG: hypothetical protein M1839_001328 [Geoglossum umbratile]|nr:MAG: hypothetical protein M1839_001328 [Geoglossum umbratile]
MYSHQSHKPLFTAQPPLPHLPQAHFYSAPNADLGMLKGREQGVVPGDSRYYCGFDSLAGSGASSDAENVLLMGWQGGLDVFRVERDKLDMIGRLEGLRGGVVSAKILPWTAREDPFSSLRPLVALVINGPVAPFPGGPGDQGPSSNHSDQLEYTSSEHPDTSAPGSTTKASDSDEVISDVTHYQTTVEVYSLSKKIHITTLFSSPPVPISVPMTTPQFSPPPEVGSLQIDANGKFITVSSGVSGEVFIFTLDSVEFSDTQSGEGGFSCIGKVWTSVQFNNRKRSSSPVGIPDAGGQSGDHTTEVIPAGTALLSLSHRWLAVIPPVPSSSPSLNGTPLPPSTKFRAPGISSHSPPPQPPVTCAVDTPEGESVFNRVAREVTQEVIKGAKWVGDQGIQAWRYYWNRPTPGTGQEWGQTRDQLSHPAPQQHHFPPTHALTNQQSQSSGDPTLISVLDLERLAPTRCTPNSAALNPIATFQNPLGCSFLSFAPSGLALLTASRKGDVQFVWDLMRMTQGKATTGPPTSTSGIGSSSDARQIPYRPHVRQIARFTRLTVANIVDVVWAMPKGERVAIVTEKRTVHILDLPASAFQWPPPRRATPSSAPPNSASKVTKDDGTHDAHTVAGGASNAVTAAVQMVNNKTQPLISAARRRRSSGASLGLKITSSGGGGQGGMLIATGLSKSLGAATGTVSNLRNTGENRLHLPGSSGSASLGCVKWLGGKERGLISIVCGGILRIHEAGPGRARKGVEKRRRLTGLKPMEFVLPTLPGDASVIEDMVCRLNREALSGYWISRPPLTTRDATPKMDPHPLSYAEIETNPPYQPFHTDRRINLYVYNTPPHDEWNALGNVHHVSESSPWVFGQDIDATKLDVGPSAIPSDEMSIHEESSVGPMETILRLGKDDEEVEQVVVTTRRRKKATSGTMGELEDGFFEDDCEVLDFASDRV